MVQIRPTAQPQTHSQGGVTCPMPTLIPWDTQASPRNGVFLKQLHNDFGGCSCLARSSKHALLWCMWYPYKQIPQLIPGPARQQHAGIPDCPLLPLQFLCANKGGGGKEIPKKPLGYVPPCKPVPEAPGSVKQGQPSGGTVHTADTLICHVYFSTNKNSLVCSVPSVCTVQTLRILKLNDSGVGRAYKVSPAPKKLITKKN